MDWFREQVPKGKAGWEPPVEAHAAATKPTQFLGFFKGQFGEHDVVMNGQRELSSSGHILNISFGYKSFCHTRS
jgi:hypothetical protein